jgi:hypothetical protein
MALRLRTLHRAKNIGSALKAGVDIDSGVRDSTMWKYGIL